MQIVEVEEFCKNYPNVPLVFTYNMNGSQNSVHLMWVNFPVGECVVQGFCEGNVNGLVFSPIDLGRHLGIEFSLT